MLTYADVCCFSLCRQSRFVATFEEDWLWIQDKMQVPPLLSHTPTYDVCSRLLTYAHICSRMLTYFHVRYRMLTIEEKMQVPAVSMRMLAYADVC